MTAFRASRGGVPIYKSALSPLLNSLATIRERICSGSHSNAVPVSTHFVSTGETLQLFSSDVVKALDEFNFLTSFCQHLTKSFG